MMGLDFSFLICVPPPAPWLPHVPEISRSNPQELNCLRKQPVSASKSSNGVNNAVGFTFSIIQLGVGGSSPLKQQGVCTVSFISSSHLPPHLPLPHHAQGDEQQ